MHHVQTGKKHPWETHVARQGRTRHHAGSRWACRDSHLLLGSSGWDNGNNSQQNLPALACQPSHHGPPGCPPPRCLVSNAALSCSVTDGGNCFNIPLLINSIFDKHRQYLSVFLEVLSWPPGAQMFYLCPPCSFPTPQGWLQLLAVQAPCGSPCRTASPALLVNCERATLKLSVKL